MLEAHPLDFYGMGYEHSGLVCCHRVGAVTASEALGAALAARVGHLCDVVRDARQPPLYRRLAASQLGEIVGRLLAEQARQGDRTTLILLGETK